MTRRQVRECSCGLRSQTRMLRRRPIADEAFARFGGGHAERVLFEVVDQESIIESGITK